MPVDWWLDIGGEKTETHLIDRSYSKRSSGGKPYIGRFESVWDIYGPTAEPCKAKLD
jgi:hypothetical protein